MNLFRPEMNEFFHFHVFGNSATEVHELHANEKIPVDFI